MFRWGWAHLTGCALALALASAAVGQESAPAGEPAAHPPATEAAPAPFPDAADLAESAPVGAGSADTAAAPASAEIFAPAPATEAASTSSPDLPLPRNLSPWGMFEAADRVVKAVMIGLAFASLVTWTIWFAKSLEILAAGARLRRGLAVVLAAGTLDEAERALSGPRGPLASMLRAARHEAAAAPAGLTRGDGGGFLARVGSHLSRIEVQAARRLNLGVGVLATIGATAPFVGLFGTVWGIMNSFIGISEAHTTSLAVVAPGIAEALLATAFGLVAAIPAVVIYNLFARWIAGYRARLADAAAAVERLASRDLDHRRLVPGVARAAE